MFRKMSLKFKMILSFMAVSSVLLLQGIVSNRTNSEVSRYFHQVVDSTVETLHSISEFSDLISEAQLTMETSGLLADPEAAANLLKKLSGFEDRFNKLDAELSKNSFEEKEGEIYKKFVDSWKTWMQSAKKGSELFFAAKNASDLDKYKDYLSKDVYQNYTKIDESLHALSEYQKNEATIVKEKGLKATKFGETLGLLMIAFGMIAACAIGFIFSTTLSKHLREITEKIHDSASNTTSASNQLTGASRQLSSGSTSSASSLEETVASLEELSSMVKTNTDHAKEANALSQKSKESAEHGEQEIAKLINAMSTIAAGSKKIEDIINVIDDIAFQTNLLALNAAVEAARAGEQGKGFAVVAEAVRNLAQRSAIAAKDIATLIKENVSKSEEGAKIAEVSGVVLTEIVTNVKKVSDLNNEISLASQEQSSGIQQISQAMNQLDRLTQGNAASAEELNTSSEVLQTQSAQFVEVVRQLRVLVDGDHFESKIAAAKEKMKKAEMKKAEKQDRAAKKSEAKRTDVAKVTNYKAVKSEKPEKFENIKLTPNKGEAKKEKSNNSGEKVDNVIPMKPTSVAKKRDAELEALLPLEGSEGADPDRKIGGIDGF